jgi:hypothetical protein
LIVNNGSKESFFTMGPVRFRPMGRIWLSQRCFDVVLHGVLTDAQGLGDVTTPDSFTRRPVAADPRSKRRTPAADWITSPAYVGTGRPARICHAAKAITISMRMRRHGFIPF